MTTIRPYRPADRADVYDVCVRTGHAGGDARGAYRDPGILPDIFAGPHLLFEPELAHVAEDGGRVVGYILGTADTPRYAERFRAAWLPGLAERYPPLTAPPASLDDFMRDLLYHPERKVRPEFAAWPAHLHIDILPGYQGRGLGRGLMETFLLTLAKQEVPGVHLGMLSVNEAARAFYTKLGFEELPVPPAKLTYLGRTVG
jgi:ribosomal protein S18 acetylase RimI-like enzyme